MRRIGGCSNCEPTTVEYCRNCGVFHANVDFVAVHFEAGALLPFVAVAQSDAGHAARSGHHATAGR